MIKLSKEKLWRNILILLRKKRALKSVVSIKQIAETVAKSANVHVKFEVPSENESVGYSKFKNAVQNSDKLQSIGWIPYVNLEEGIVRTIDIKLRK